MKDLFLLKETDVFQNYPDHKSLDNVLDSVFDTYYKDWPQRYIIDRGPVMTPGNFMLISKHFRRPFKCIIILRDVLEANYVSYGFMFRNSLLRDLKFPEWFFDKNFFYQILAIWFGEIIHDLFI